MRTPVCAIIPVWRPKDDFIESVFSSTFKWCLRIVLGLPAFCNNCLYPRSHLAGPNPFFLINKLS